MKQFFYFTIILILIVSTGFIGMKYYSYIFAKDVKGIIENVEKPVNPVAVVGGMNSNNNNQMSAAEKMYYSYAVAIRDVKTGEIFTASSEDRQWAVADKGKCVDAKFYPYPPWEFDKAGTFFGARLLRMYDCPVQ